MRFLFGTIGVFAAAGVLLAGCELLNGKKEKPHPPSIPGKIVFSMADDSEMENYQIYVMNTDGSDMKQLTHFESDEAFLPSWSPDGEQIVFSTSLRSSSAGASLYVMNADGSNIRPLKERPNTHVVTAGYHPKWSPDGSKIAFDFCDNCNAGGKNHEIFVYDFETDSVIQITNHPARDNNPEWSPNGDELAFVSGRDYFDADTLRFRDDIYILNTSEKMPNKITNTGYAGRQLWLPDGDELIYWSLDKLFNLELSSKMTTEVDINLPPETGFRPVGLMLNGEIIMLHSFEYGRVKETNSLTLVNLKTKEVNEIDLQSQMSGADWHYFED